MTASVTLIEIQSQMPTVFATIGRGNRRVINDLTRRKFITRLGKRSPAQYQISSTGVAEARSIIASI